VFLATGAALWQTLADIRLDKLLWSDAVRGAIFVALRRVVPLGEGECWYCVCTGGIGGGGDQAVCRE